MDRLHGARVYANSSCSSFSSCIHRSYGRMRLVGSSHDLPAIQPVGHDRLATATQPSDHVHGHPATATSIRPRPRPRPSGHGHSHPATATATAIRPRPRPRTKKSILIDGTYSWITAHITCQLSSGVDQGPESEPEDYITDAWSACSGPLIGCTQIIRMSHLSWNCG